MVTKFAESGILSTYLHDNCDKKSLKLCAYKDQIPSYSWEFLWNPESPLYKTGGWDANKEEHNAIIHDVFTTPKYLSMFMEKSAISTGKQLFQVQAPEHTSMLGKDSEPWKKIGEFFKDELAEYTISRQNAEGWGAGFANTIYYIFFAISTLWVLFYGSLLPKQVLLIYQAILLYFIINAFVTSTFSTVHYRFQYRIFWVLPGTNAILIIKHYYTKLKMQFKRLCV